MVLVRVLVGASEEVPVTRPEAYSSAWCTVLLPKARSGVITYMCQAGNGVSLGSAVIGGSVLVAWAAVHAHVGAGERPC